MRRITEDNVLKLHCGAESPGRLIKHRLPGPNSKVCDSAGLGWDPVSYIANKFLGDAVATSLGTRFCKLLVQEDPYYIMGCNTMFPVFIQTFMAKGF